MKHKLHRLFIVTSFCIFPLLAMSHESSAWTPGESYAVEALSQDLSEISITVEGRQVKVQNAQGKFIEVYDITGKRVYYAQIDSNEKYLTLNLHKGCYILRVGTVTRKIYLS